MKKHYIGLDMLRGIGVFAVVNLHSALYYYGGLYDLDMSNPPPIVTVIGLFLMFAGLFAMISGMGHHIQFMRKSEAGTSVLKYKITSGLLILAIGYVYFIFTGPALINFADRSLDSSLLVEFISSGRLVGISMDRLLYVDSLIMIGSNIILGSLIASAIYKYIAKKKERANAFLGSALSLLVLSIIRIPLYDLYLQAIEKNNTLLVLALNWLVNKNNPILPFLAFGLLGMWLAELVSHRNKNIYKVGLPVATSLFLLGIFAYINLPDTMLERSIDLKWFSIMVAQMGLFTLMIILAMRVYDKVGVASPAKAGKRPGFLGRFINRFGVAGLTVFFLESILSSITFRIMRFINPAISLSMGQSLLFGFALAIFWGIFLMIWEKSNYKFGLEYFYVRALNKLGKSAKEDKLRGGVTS